MRSQSKSLLLKSTIWLTLLANFTAKAGLLFIYLKPLIKIDIFVNRGDRTFKVNARELDAIAIFKNL
jgi:hypothetical protein